MGLSIAMPQKMKTTVKVRNHHIDAYGHVNNARYLNYLEDARSDFFEELGVGLHLLAERGIHVVLTDVTASFRYPAKLGDLLDVYGWFIDISTRKATWGHEIRQAASGKTVMTGTATGVFLQRDRIITIPADVRQVMASLFLPDSV